MTLNDQIKQDRLTFKKQGFKKEADVLTTLMSEIQRLDKSDQENDNKVISVIKKYAKGLDEMIELLECSSKKTEAEEELKVVSVYLPKQLTESELTSVIDYAIAETDAQTMKDMGKVMKLLKERHDGLYDGKMASTIVREKLA